MNGRILCCTGSIWPSATLLLCTHKGPRESFIRCSKKFLKRELLAPVSRRAEQACYHKEIVTQAFIDALNLSKHDEVLGRHLYNGVFLSMLGGKKSEGKE